MRDVPKNIPGTIVFLKAVEVPGSNTQMEDTPELSVIIAFAGTVITDATVNYAATFTSDKGAGFNLVGNPFTSTIAITTDGQATDNFLADNSGILDVSYQAVYIWNESSGYTYGDNDYSVICNSGFSGQGSSSEISQDYIEPGQGFMVKVNDDGNVVFNKDTQKHGAGDYYKSKDGWPGVELGVSGNNNTNPTIICFNENMTPGLDPSYDIGKIKGNPNIALYTKLIEDNDVDFAIQALPFARLEEFEIPVGIDILETTTFEFSVYQENLDNYNIVLEDRQEGTFTNLRWDTYFATISESGTGRFYLHFKDATAIEESPYNSAIRVYAAERSIFIRGTNTGYVCLFDLTGRIIMQQDFSGEGMISIPASLKTGIYVVTVQNGKEVKTGKVFIK